MIGKILKYYFPILMLFTMTGSFILVYQPKTGIPWGKFSFFILTVCLAAWGICAIKLDSKNIRVKGRWVIFTGFLLAICAVLLVATVRNGQIHGISENFLPYVVTGIPLAIIVIGMVTCDYLPQKLVTTLGLIGWMTTVLILCLFK